MSVDNLYELMPFLYFSDSRYLVGDQKRLETVARLAATLLTVSASASATSASLEKSSLSEGCVSIFFQKSNYLYNELTVQKTDPTQRVVVV